MIRVGPCRSFSTWQRMRLTRVRPARCHHLGSADPGIRDPGCSPGRVDVSTRSNALYDRCATEEASGEVRPMASKRAGQRGMRLLEGSDSRRLLVDHRSRLGSRGWAAFPLVRGWMWAWEDLNLRLHTYQQSGAYRCATLRFCRSCVTVRGEVMRCSKRTPKGERGWLPRP